MRRSAQVHLLMSPVGTRAWQHARKLRLDLAVLLAISIGLSIPLILNAWPAGDWDILTEAGSRIAAGLNPYGLEGEGSFRYSPLVAHLFRVIAPIGFIGWTVLWFVALFVFIRDWRAVRAFLVAFPFWADVVSGVSFLPVPLVAVMALRGSRAATIGLVVLFALMPRPLMLPMLGWLLWRDRGSLVWSAAIGLALLIATGATGWADEWVVEMMSLPTTGAAFSPASFLGPLWLVMVPLAAWLTWRGNIGFAGLVISPYWVPSYLMLLLLEIVPRPPTANDGARVATES